MRPQVETPSDGQRIRACYTGQIRWEFRERPLPVVLLAYTSEGWMVTHEGAGYWMRGEVFDGGVVLRRLEHWRAEHHEELPPDPYEVPADFLPLPAPVRVRTPKPRRRRSLVRILADLGGRR